MNNGELTPLQMAAALRKRAQELLQAAAVIEHERSLLAPVETGDDEADRRQRHLDQLAAARAARSAKARARATADQAPALPRRKGATPERSGPGRPATREQELVQFLQTNGPTQYKDLVDRSGIPTGTLTSILKRSKLITKNADGKWEAIVKQ